MSGIDCIQEIKSRVPNVKILMHTVYEDEEQLFKSLRAGAHGYLLKSTPPGELVRAIRLVHQGKKRIPPEVAAQVAEYVSDDELTPREVDVLRLVAEGNGNREIAERLFISEETVKGHVKNAMGKLGAVDRTQAVTIAIRRGFIQL